MIRAISMQEYRAVAVGTDFALGNAAGLRHRWS
jgi:hypothetical protein